MIKKKIIRIVKDKAIQSFGLKYLILLTFIILIVWLFILQKENDGFLNPKEDVEQAKSSYRLKEMRFTNFVGDKKEVMTINIEIALGYPKNNFMHEKEIIEKKEKINRFIQSYLSQKSYYELDEAEEKEMMKKELLRRINLSMRYPVEEIYYRKFLVMKQEEE